MQSVGFMHSGIKQPVQCFLVKAISRSEEKDPNRCDPTMANEAPPGYGFYWKIRISVQDLFRGRQEAERVA